jgi:hypothetical protein
MRPEIFTQLVRHSRVILLVLSASHTLGWAQEGPPRAAKPERVSLAASLRQLQAQVHELESALAQMRAETASYRAEMLQMHHELQAARTQFACCGRALEAPMPAQATSSSGPAALENVSVVVPSPQGSNDDQRLAKLEEDHQLLAGKVDEQYQSKVESASKYRVRLSGIVLLNVFSNRGTVDNLDFPTISAQRGVLDSGGSFGTTLRQTQLGLEVFGAQLAGAKASAAVQLDFSGGFPNTVNGVSFGLVRLRTATLRLDWARTSVVAGQDTLFFSPLSPTSLASLSVPAFSYAGNLWAWIPQLRVEHNLDISENSRFTFQGGIVAPQTGELPATSFLRSAQAGERSRQPGYATRIAWSHGAPDRSVVVGVGGYYSRQRWGFSRTVDGWVGTADWSVPLGRWVGLTGEFYRGRAIGGLEGAIGRSVLTRGPLATPGTLVRGLNATGGWAQLKFEPTARLEFNAAWGQDNPSASDLRQFPVNLGSIFGRVVRNRSSFVNFIYRPRSDLLFSTEYRRLRTWDIRGGSQTADHVNLSMGILF